MKNIHVLPKQKDFEVWKDVVGYEGLYQVSNFGNIKSLKRYVKGKVENRLQKEKILSKRLVGAKGNQYYAVTLCNNKDRKQFKVSVLVAMVFLNHTPNGYVGFIVDHIDNNPLNNNLNNLQVITKRENSSKDKKSISKYTGVTFNKKSNKWRAQIWINGKNKTLGIFDDELKAHRAYQKELKQHLKSQSDENKETLEEFAENYVNKFYNNYAFKDLLKPLLTAGAKWQQQQMYSELVDLLERLTPIYKEDSDLHQKYDKQRLNLIEQFKKK